MEGAVGLPGVLAGVDGLPDDVVEGLGGPRIQDVAKILLTPLKSSTTCKIIITLFTLLLVSLSGISGNTSCLEAGEDNLDYLNYHCEHQSP